MNKKSHAINKVYKAVIDILNGRQDIIKGSRAIAAFADDIDDKNEIFNIFRLIDSESDDFPLGKERELYNKKYLAKLDSEMLEYLEEYKERVHKQCYKLKKWLPTQKLKPKD